MDDLDGRFTRYGQEVMAETSPPGVEAVRRTVSRRQRRRTAVGGQRSYLIAFAVNAAPQAVEQTVDGFVLRVSELLWDGSQLADATPVDNELAISLALAPS